MQHDSINSDSRTIQHPIYQSQVSTSMRFRQPCNSQKKKGTPEETYTTKVQNQTQCASYSLDPAAGLNYCIIDCQNLDMEINTRKEVELSKTWGIPTKDVCGMWKFTNKMIFLHWDFNCIQKPNECDLEYSSC